MTPRGIVCHWTEANLDSHQQEENKDSAQLSRIDCAKYDDGGDDHEDGDSW